ncbi:MAG: cupin domain-containing protein [Anaerolineales bacterium]|nr:MAG: cupin domain-containing protein [Anaerolineales bacterium]
MEPFFDIISSETIKRGTMDIFDQDAVSVNISDRLRKLREERELSIRALGRLSGLSANALSVIERGMSSPSVSTLYKIATALEIPVTAFFEEKPPKQDIVLIKSSERNRIPLHRGLWEGLGGERYEGAVEPFMITLEAGSSSGRFPMTHTGNEFVFCLRGKLNYEICGETYHLEAGDALLFAADQEHQWHNPGNTVTNALIMICGFKHGETPGKYHLASSAPESIE